MAVCSFRLPKLPADVLHFINLSCGMGVDTKLMAPPVVNGPYCTWLLPFNTSMAYIRAAFGK